MLQVNVQEAKTHLSRYLDAAENGEVVGELRPIAAPRDPSGIPRFGLWEGFGVADSFFEPLPDEMLNSFGSE